MPFSNQAIILIAYALSLSLTAILLWLYPPDPNRPSHIDTHPYPDQARIVHVPF